jgi:hypothetical protein
MTSTGTTAFNPATSDLVLNAFSRIQITSSQLTTEHLVTADLEANLAQVKFANKQPNWWKSELVTQSLSFGSATYTLPARVVTIVLAYMTTVSGSSSTDRVITPISTSEYASYPNKTTQGAPTSFWFDRQITPQVTVWPVPDASSTYTLKLRVLSQMEDASGKSGYTPDFPYRWIDAFSDELTARLSRHFKPEQFQMHKAAAMESWEEAAAQDNEDVPIYVTPSISGYFR